MIHITDITGIKYEADEQTRRYVSKKIGRLERYIPRQARRSATAEIKLKQINQSHGNKYEAEVILSLPERTLTAKDSTANVLAAIDIVERKLAGQLRRYKTETVAHTGRHSVITRLKRRYITGSQGS